MTGPNDTLRGRLYAYEREDEKKDRNSFGYWHNIEVRMIRAELAAEGFDLEASPMRTGELIRQRLERNHANDETYRETSARILRESRARSLAEFEAGTRPASVQLTKPMLEFLAEHFEGANDPTAQEILARVQRALEDR